MALDKTYAWYINRVGNNTPKLALVEKDTAIDGDWKTISTAGKFFRAWVKGVSTTNDLTTDSVKTSSLNTEIPNRYHESIVNLSIAMGYLKPGPSLNPEMYTLFKQLYSEEALKAKKFIKMGYRSSGAIKPVDF